MFQDVPAAGDSAETARQRALDAYRMVGSMPEDVFDDIVQVAAAVCGAPIALVSLIDRDRQWFKARVGLETQETSRDIAVCDHAIRSPRELFEVGDLEADPRFSANPLVTGDPGVRFYAGVPLLSPSGAAIGTICVLDYEPRGLEAAQRTALAALSRITMHVFDQCSTRRMEERQAVLQSVGTRGQAQAAPHSEFMVAILELQDHGKVIERLGGLAQAEQTLQALQAELQDCLPGDGRDVISRSSGSAEFTAVLHGPRAPEVLECLRGVLQRTAREHDLHVLVGAAEPVKPGEPMEDVFMNADELLSQAKDAHRRALR